MSNTIRGNLIDAINEITKLLDVTEDPNERFEIRIKIRELYQRLDRVVVAELSSETKAFKEALEALRALTKEAKGAKRDVDKIAAVIKSAAKAVSKVEKLVKKVAGVLPIL